MLLEHPPGTAAALQLHEVKVMMGASPPWQWMLQEMRFKGGVQRKLRHGLLHIFQKLSTCTFFKITF